MPLQKALLEKTPTKNKNIIICSDGTGNTGIKGRGTNVFKLYEAVDLHGHNHDPNLTPQVAFYDDGVGTESLKPLKLLGGAFGWGLSRNVMQLYAELARVYEPGDHIFLFGFSRGAFTVRTLAGLIMNCGIPGLDRKGVKQAYLEYREKKYRKPLYQHFRKPYDEQRMNKFQKDYAVVHHEEVRIQFIGVWDTVDAVGLPDDLAYFINKFIYCFKFPDGKLSPRVKRACHALSIDDERHTFHPVMWDEKKESEDRIEQVWFPGVHSNVGGGYPKQGLSIVALYWMMKKAEESGLRFIRSERQFYHEHQNANDKLYNSRAGLGVCYRYKPRDIGKICKQHGITPKIHISTIERIMQGTEGYAPGNIPQTYEIVSTEPVSESVKKVTKAFRDASDGDPALLEKVKAWVLVKRYTHYLFLALSLMVIYLALFHESSQSGISAVLGGLVSGDGLMRFTKNLLYKSWLLGVVLMFYAIGWCVSRRMNRVFAEHWHTVLRERKMRARRRRLHLTDGVAV